MSYKDLTKGRFSIVGHEYFVTFTTAHRQPILCDFEIGKRLARIIHNESDIFVWAWVIMPDHVHILLQLKRGSLSGAMQRIKGRSSFEINKVHQNFKWSSGYYEHALRKEEARKEIARYIVANPLRAGLVKSLRHYPWWNAAFL